STQLVAFTAASNVLGNKTPVDEITKIARDAGSLSLIDAAQSAGHYKMDFRKINADFIAFSGHKMLGPTGTGVLYKKEGVELDSAIVGGGTITDASLHDYKLLANREALEAGTPNIGGVIGLGAAVDYLSKIGLDNVLEHDRKLVKKIMDGFTQVDGVEYYGPRKIEDKTSVVSFNVRGSDAHQTALLCDSLARVCVRSGHHCAIPVTKLLGVKSTARASVYLYNTEAEADKFLDAVTQITKLS
ncbi:aminotransferase class V-fold PLP-dependent enzyme, partial [Candidatus Micrarchaeota archaeon]|nr:aminotransferase class V-fold PLP-dependent enzyme [Candidatus Micrarchaeota archaeon]